MFNTDNEVSLDGKITLGKRPRDTKLQEQFGEHQFPLTVREVLKFLSGEDASDG